MCKTPLIIYGNNSVPKNRFKDSDDIVTPAIVDNPDDFPRDICDPPIYSVVDHHLPFRVVPCGKCVDCAKKRRSDWYVRVRRQIECGAYKSVFWVTLTFRDEHLPTTKAELAILIRRYKDVLRKKYGGAPDHFMITERGDDPHYSHRLHIHGFLMFQHVEPSFEDIRNAWHYGHLWVQKPKTMACITYTMKYIFKAVMQKIKGEPLASLVYCSKGIGAVSLGRNSYRLQLNVNPTYRPTENFGTRFEYWLPRYLFDKVCKIEGAKPEYTPQMLLEQLMGVRPPRTSVDQWISHRLLQMHNALRNGHSFVRKVPNIGKAFMCLMMKYPYLLNYGKN